MSRLIFDNIEQEERIKNSAQCDKFYHFWNTNRNPITMKNHDCTPYEDLSKEDKKQMSEFTTSKYVQ